MINPTIKDIGRRVSYLGIGHSNRFVIDEGVISSFNDKFVFVYYPNGNTMATSREDLEWCVEVPVGEEALANVSEANEQKVSVSSNDILEAIAGLNRHIEGVKRIILHPNHLNIGSCTNVSFTDAITDMEFAIAVIKLLEMRVDQMELDNE